MRCPRQNDTRPCYVTRMDPAGEQRPEPDIFGVAREGDSSAVEIVWRGDVAADVIVSSNWAELLTPPGLLGVVRDLVNAHRGGTAGLDWRFNLSLANVAPKDWAEFTAQLADARAEAAAQASAPQVSTTLHFRAVWHDGALLELTGDDTWSRLPLEVMGKDIAAAIVAPETPAVTTVARDRLLKLMERGA